MDLTAASWVLATVTGFWLLGTVALTKIQSAGMVVLQIVLSLAVFGTWIWYAFYTGQYAFIVIVLSFLTALIGGYNGSNKS